MKPPRPNKAELVAKFLQVLNTCAIIQTGSRVELVPFAWETLGGSELYENEAKKDAEQLAETLAELRAISEREHDRRHEKAKEGLPL